MRSERCNRCRFWNEDMKVRDPNDENFGFGQCRKDQPRIIEPLFMGLLGPPSYNEMLEPELRTVQVTMCTYWPATTSDDWCGRFEREEGAITC